MSSEKQLPIGTRIKFLKWLYADADGESPARTYAEAGEDGVVTGYNNREGYWVKCDDWSQAEFGSEYGTEFVEDSGNE